MSLVYGPGAEAGIPLEDGKAYKITVEVLVTGSIFGGARCTQSIKRSAIYTCTGGTAVLVAADTQASYGDAAGASWALAFSTSSEKATMDVTLTGTRCKAHAVSRTEFEEVIFDAGF